MTTTKEEKKAAVKGAVDGKATVEGKATAVKQALADIEKKFGKGSIMVLGDKPIAHMDVIHSGALALDRALGVGGVPRGRIIEIYGPEAGGKTTMALQFVAECQKMGGTAAFVDAEHSLDLNMAKNVGVDIEHLLFSQPDYGEQALEIVETLVRSQGVDIIVVDSVSALTPRAEIEGEMGDPSMGVQARLMSQALRKLAAVVSKSNTVLIFINQLRMKIGVMFGNPETTTGGNALKFWASVRLDVRRIEAIKRNEVIIGNRTRVKVVKNKVAPPFREAMITIIFGWGIDKYADLLSMALEYQLVERSGAWYTCGDKRLGQGEEAAIQTLKDDVTFCNELRKWVVDKMFPAVEAVPEKTSQKAKA